MSYRVINAKTGEIVADFATVDHFSLAMDLANKLAEDKLHREQFIVTQTVTVYETPLSPSTKGGANGLNG
jgi:hypothetical protein